MIAKEELKQIEDYLLLYKIPLDILLEVKDHMSTQIAEIQAEKEITFEKAFIETKLAWENDLKQTRFTMYTADEIPMIVKKMIKGKYWNLFKKSLLLGVVSLLLNFLYVYLSKDLNTFTNLFRIQSSVFFLAPLVFWIANIKIWKYFKSDFKFQGKVFYTIYQNTASLFFLSSILMVQIFNSGGTYLFNYLKVENSANIIQFLITVIGILYMQTNVIFLLFVLSKHKQTLNKIQNNIVE